MASLQANFPPWLWDAFEAYFEKREIHDMLGFEHIHRERMKERVEQLAVAKKQEFRKGYPHRPDGPAPDSESFARLKDLLANAPGTDGKNFSYDNEAPEGLSVEHDGFSDSYVVNWTSSFVGTIKQAVEAVVAEHGAKHKVQALWSVYDTVSHVLFPRPLSSFSNIS